MTVKINKTNAARLLDKAKIAYELVPYEVDENNPYERTVTGNRVYPGRMLSGRNEKGFAHFYSYYLHGFRVYLHQCRDAGITDQDCAGRSGGIYPGRGYRSYSHLTRLP